MSLFTIKAAAQTVDRSPDTLRLWESQGLVQPSRDSNGRRVYSEHDLATLKQIAARHCGKSHR